MSALLEELRCNFPLLQDVAFRDGICGKPLPLPPVIGVLAAATNPDISGDTCVVIPNRECIAITTTILVALSAARDNMSDRLKDYLEKGFQVGDRVAVRPDGYVYEYAGFIDSEHGRFFRLRFIDDETNASRSFPILDAVRLEKTTRKRPLGRGNTRFSAFKKSELDKIIKADTGGNEALLSNEVMLVTTQSAFREFMDRVFVSYAEDPDKAFPLNEVVPWGIANHNGDIQFRGTGAATGEPLVAISSRAEYIAAACRRRQNVSPRVIIDGANRIKDLQAFDDIVDKSKLLVIADHTEIEQFDELDQRNCTIWKLPDDLNGMFGGEAGILKTAQEAYCVAAQFSLKIINCESEPIDQICASVTAAEKLIQDNESDDAVFKVLSIAYARLLDLSSIVHDVDEGELAEVKAAVEKGRQYLSSFQIILQIPRDAQLHLESAFDEIEKGLNPSASEFRIGKQVRLLELVEELSKEERRIAIVGQTNTAVASADKLVHSEIGPGVSVSSISDLRDEGVYDDIILTSWPKARNFLRLINHYRAANIHVLAYSFESKWFSGASDRRRRQLYRWELEDKETRKITGLVSSLGGRKTQAVIPGSPDVEPPINDIEGRLSRMKKGHAAPEMQQQEARDAKYVGFLGQTYCYLSETHKLPLITGLIRGETGLEKSNLYATINELETGDYVLFRVHDDGDKEMVRVIAEQQSGVKMYNEARGISDSWKPVVESLGDDAHSIYRALTEAGLRLGYQAVRTWLKDPNHIGPGTEHDLLVIARAAGDPKFKKRVPDIWKKIMWIRSEHIKAGYNLSQLLIQHLPGQLPELGDWEAIVELSFEDIALGKIAIVQVETISSDYEQRPYWEINRLHWEQD